MSRDELVTEVLGELKKMNNNMHTKKQLLNDFLRAVKEIMVDGNCDLLQEAFFRHVGSGFEGTAVNDCADFDILLVLPEPYRGKFFDVIKRHEPGFFKLKWIDDECDRPKFINKNGFLEAERLRGYIFDELTEVLNEVRTENNHWNLMYKPLLTSMNVKLIDNSGCTVKMDIVAQIAEAVWDDVPEIIPKKMLPPAVKDFVNVDFPMFYNLSPSLHLNEVNDAHLLVSTSFSTLEKRCLKESDGVREAVMLAKLTSQSRGWKKLHGLRAFHIKRNAIKHYDELDDLLPWFGFQKLLTYLSNDLRDNTIDGYFIKDQDVFCRDENTCKTLADKIMEAKSSINPRNLRDLLPDED